MRSRETLLSITVEGRPGAGRMTMAIALSHVLGEMGFKVALDDSITEELSGKDICDIKNRMVKIGIKKRMRALSAGVLSSYGTNRIVVATRQSSTAPTRKSARIKS